ncbi:MAG TPA: chromosomal replication initiator protein DnaA [Flavipsychrobacter sp.]|mgnify:CR=1 FL=1|nr:chromosomal replication initiator protein DnaA [Flavipsychrobacter sp.]
MDNHLYNTSNSINEAEAVWNKCLSIIKDNINWRTYQTWFEPIRAAALTGAVLTLQVPSQFFYEWLEEHYVELLGKTIKRILGREGKLEYRILMESSTSQRNPASINMPASNHTKPSKDSNYVDMPLKWDDPTNIKTPYAIPGLKRMQIDPQLNANYLFDNYVEGDCNRVARSAGLHVAQKPGATSFNPLVVFGGVGWGKTHLVQAIGNEVRRLHPNKAVLYVSAEKFINQFIDHSRNNEVNDFIHFYQLIDVLILDDIHLFVPATKTQDVFFAIFNHLHQSGKQIILTSDTPPKDMEGMQERLLSRFRWGLNADIQAPDFETRQHILHVKMKQEGLEIPEEVVKYVAYNVQTNVRELEGALIALFAQATLNRKEIDIDLAKRVMKNFVKTAAREVTIESIQKMVCEYFHLPYDRLLAKTRKREVVQARQITMYLAKKFTKSSLKNIGEHFGGFDHTTVIHSCQTVVNLMDTDTEYKEHLLELQQKVQLASI